MHKSCVTTRPVQESGNTTCVSFPPQETFRQHFAFCILNDIDMAKFLDALPPHLPEAISKTEKSVHYLSIVIALKIIQPSAGKLMGERKVSVLQSMSKVYLFCTLMEKIPRFAEGCG